jgi:hypothetical protein
VSFPIQFAFLDVEHFLSKGLDDHQANGVCDFSLFSCPYCGDEFDSNSELLEHAELCEDGPGEFSSQIEH